MISWDRGPLAKRTNAFYRIIAAKRSHWTCEAVLRVMSISVVSYDDAASRVDPETERTHVEGGLIRAGDNKVRSWNTKFQTSFQLLSCFTTFQLHILHGFMWAFRQVRSVSTVLAEASTSTSRPLRLQTCRRCLNSSSSRRVVLPLCPPRSSSSTPSRRRFQSTLPGQSHTFVSAAEETQMKLLESAGKKVDEYHRAANDVSGLDFQF